MAQAVLLPKVGHGFSVEKNWMPQFKQAFLGIIEKKASQQIPQSAEVSDLPVVEVPAGGPQRDFFAVLISGDGGWAGIDRDIAAALSREGVSVIGLNSLKYFWKARTPEGTARDLDRIIRHYCAAWNKEKLILVGYSFGADVLPFLANRLGQESFNRIQLMAFLGLSPSADFEFHLTDWLGGSSSPTAKPVLPEIEKLKGRRMICFYGTEEKESLGKSIDTAIVKSIPIEGGHHFGNKYDDIAATILRETQNVK
jgi:type IV secretory pathway VirJ component